MEESDLRRLLREYTHAPGYPESYRRIGKYYHLAGCIIGLELGEDWLLRHVMSQEKPSAYFRTDPGTAEQYIRFMARVGLFGELIYNLHKVENFDAHLKSIQTANGDGVEAGIAELFGGMCLKVIGVPFRFVKERRVKGADYDIEYVRADSRVGRCEVKCKLQSSDLTANGIVNILKTAKGQLPKGIGTGMVMLRAPEEWDAPDKFDALIAVASAVGDFFAKERTKRISSVLVVQHRTIIADGQMGQYPLMRPVENPHCPVDSGLPPLTPMRRQISNWTPLFSLIP